MFPFHKSEARLTAGKHVCSINSNAFPEFRRIIAGGKHFVKLRLTTLKLWIPTNDQIKFLSGDGNKVFAGYNNRTSGMKPVFRLFCVAVNN